MAKVKAPTYVTKYVESIDVKPGMIVSDTPVTNRKVYRKRSEDFRRVRLTFANGSTKDYRERFRVPVTVEA